MKNLTIITDAEEYENWLINDVIATPALTNDPFYRRLFLWVARHRSPIFFETTHDHERTAFSNWWNLIAVRDYDNSNLNALYLLHEFAHLLTATPHDIANTTDEQLVQAVIDSETVASNESELLVHWRIPELRETILQNQRILFDALKDQGWDKPPAGLLFDARHQWIEEDGALLDLLGDDPAAQSLSDWFAYFRGNQPWTLTWKNKLLTTKLCHHTPGVDFGALSPRRYEQTLNAWNPDEFDPNVRQAIHEQNIIENVRIAFAACGLEPPTLSTVFDAEKAAKTLVSLAFLPSSVVV